MAQQFSLPQKQVLEDLDGEGYSRLTDGPAGGSPCYACLGGASHPLILGSTWPHPRRGRVGAQLWSTVIAVLKDREASDSAEPSVGPGEAGLMGEEGP